MVMENRFNSAIRTQSLPRLYYGSIAHGKYVNTHYNNNPGNVAALSIEFSTNRYCLTHERNVLGIRSEDRLNVLIYVDGALPFRLILSSVINLLSCKLN